MSATNIEESVNAVPKLEYNSIIKAGKAKMQGIFDNLQDNLFWNDEIGRIVFITQNINMANEDYIEIFNEFYRAVEIDPKKADAYFCAGVVMAKARSESSALGCLDKAIELDPKNGEAYLVRGAVKNILCDYQGAEKDMNTAAKLGIGSAKEFAEKIKERI